MRKVAFVRHGKAEKQGENQKDIDRLLSEIGIGQAQERKATLNGQTFDLIISSPAPRARKTGAIVSGVPESEIVVVESLYPNVKEGVGKRIDTLFNKIGYESVSVYEKDPDGGAVREWAEGAWSEVDDVIIDRGDPAFVGVFGHAVLLQGAAIIAAGENQEVVAQLLELNLGECEGFVLTFSAQHEVIGLELLQG